MDERRLLPMVGGVTPERADAARNRRALLQAAAAMVRSCGVASVTMDAVAERAGVGKGTVFRRFESREGLMGAVLDFTETEWQQAVLTGPPPLGPGADPLARLQALGHSRIELTLQHAALIRAAGTSGSRPYAVISFVATHVRHLLGLLEVTGDLTYLATALLAPLEVTILEQQILIEGAHLHQLRDGWDDLVRRVIAG